MICLLAFRLDDWRCALPLDAVERTYRAVALTPLPEAPEPVLGIVNVHGLIHTVFDIRRRFRLPPRALSPADHLIIARASRRPVALLVDEVIGVLGCTKEDVIAADTLLPDLRHLQGVVRLPEGLLLIQDIDGFLSQDEKAALERALGER